jgi:hypothetical protein
MFELVHATYLSYLLWTSGYGKAERGMFSIAEKELDVAAHQGYASNVWRISPEAVEALKPVLQVYDDQIDQVPVAVLMQAKAKLKQLFHARRVLEHAQSDS